MKQNINWVVRARAIFLSLTVALFAACQTVPETGRSALRLLPESQLEAMAGAQFSQMRQEMPVSHDPQMNARLQEIGQRVAAVVRDDLPNTQWEFVLFDDDSVNAFAMPGGRVGFFTGMFRIAETDDELAVVMGHEIAHVVARHGNERVSQQLLVSGLGLGLLAGTRSMDQSQRELIMAAFGAGATLGILLPYSRHHESEADEIGLIYSARAGYDPRAAITFWQKMDDEARQRGNVPEFLSTHPSGDRRIRDLEAIMPRAIGEYERARANRR